MDAKHWSKEGNRFSVHNIRGTTRYAVPKGMAVYFFPIRIITDMMWYFLMIMRWMCVCMYFYGFVGCLYI